MLRDIVVYVLQSRWEYLLYLCNTRHRLSRGRRKHTVVIVTLELFNTLHLTNRQWL